MQAIKREERTQSVPVRLDKEMRDSIRSAARRAKTNASALIRFAIVNQLDEMNRTGELRVRANN